MKRNIYFAVFTAVILMAFVNTGFSQKLYFCEEYKDGKEIGKSSVFTIGPNGGYMTCMIDLRNTGKTVGTSSVKLRIAEITGSGDDVLASPPFDVQSDWDYIFFDKFYTFTYAGKFRVTALRSDGTKIASGIVKIEMR
jgi:hypothetical protein